MSLEIIKQINVDFHDTKYISINAKQYDKESRFILVTCCDQGKVLQLDKDSNYAYIRYEKPDDLGVFNSCEITDDGKILIELSEQMLAFAGKCCADVIVADGEIKVNMDEDVTITSSGKILSTMTFCINVIETAFDNVEMESSYEYNGLNDLVNKALAEYTEVITICRDLRENAKTSEANAKESEINAATSELNASNSEKNASTSEANAKVSETNAKLSESNASTSETNAKESETKAKESEEKSKVSEENAKLSENNAKTSETNASVSEANALASETKARESENNAGISEANASVSETNAKESEENAKLSEINASSSESNAKTSEDNAGNYADIATTKATEASQSATESAENAQVSISKAIESSDYANLSKSYAVGDTGVRSDEDVDNSKYYYIQTKAISDSIDGSLVPMGTISFEQLQSVSKDTGYMYHINEDFVTDDTFKSGAGVSYTAGTNVYYTADGYWDCFVGSTLNNVLATIDALNTTIESLQKRIVELENQTVLEITD